MGILRNENGGTSIEEKIDWIPNEKPRQGQGWTFIKGIAIMWILSFIFLIVVIGIWIYYSHDNLLDDIPWQLLYFAIFGNIVFGSGVISIYYETVQAIFINKVIIKIRFNFGRIKSYNWDQIEYVIIGFDDETYVWIRGGKNTYDFFVPKSIVKKIVEYYEQKTGKKPENSKEYFNR